MRANNRYAGTTDGVKADDATRERIKMAASRIDRTPHWLIKQAIALLSGPAGRQRYATRLPALFAGAANESEEPVAPQDRHKFLEFAEQILPNPSRAASHWRRKPMRCQCWWEQARLSHCR